MITKEDIIKKWKFTKEYIELFYNEVGESLKDVSSISGVGIDDYLIEEILEEDKDHIKRLKNLKHLYNPNLENLVPPNELLLIGCISNQYYLDEIKKFSDVTETFYYPTKIKIFDDSKMKYYENLEYVDSYDMLSFLENDHIENLDKVFEVLAYVINKCQQIKVNWFLVLNYFAEIKI